jgi:hypothetical protein
LAIGPSTLKNQGASGVADEARQFLKKIKLKKFCVETQNNFKRVLDNHTNRLRKRLPVGAQNWGTARKALNIFLRDVVYNRYLCSHHHISYIEKWLEVPLDSYVVKGLKKDKPETVRLPRWSSIKGLTPKTSEVYQKAAQIIARQEGISPVHLDISTGEGERIRKRDYLKHKEVTFSSLLNYTRGEFLAPGNVHYSGIAHRLTAPSQM